MSDISNTLSTTDQVPVLLNAHFEVRQWSAVPFEDPRLRDTFDFTGTLFYGPLHSSGSLKPAYLRVRRHIAEVLECAYSSRDPRADTGTNNILYLNMSSDQLRQLKDSEMKPCLFSCAYSVVLASK